MKKFLLGCAAASVLLIGIAVVHMQTPTEKNTPSSLPNKPTEDVKTYSEAEIQILEAAESYLYYKNLDDIIRADIRSEGDDFIITFDDPTDPQTPPHELKMVRIADFNGKKQYKITTNSWVKWNEDIRQHFETPQVSIGEYEETISWVPDLSLKSNTSLKANDIILKNQDLSVTVGAIVSDSLVGPRNNKMDIALATDIADIEIKSPIFTLTIPRLIQETQISGSNQTGIQSMQVLTSEKSVSSVHIPTLTFTAPKILNNQPVTGTIETGSIFENNPIFTLNISNIQVPQPYRDLAPTHINTKINLENISKDDLISYINLQDKYIQVEDLNSKEAEALEQQLTQMSNDLLTKAILKIDNLTAVLNKGEISLTGTIKYAEPALSIDATLTVTDFDAISPKAGPMDEKACENALKEHTPQSPLPAECIQQAGALEFLRPYLDINQRTQNDAGQTVDTFKINYSADNLIINGQSVLPQNKNKGAVQEKTAEIIQE